MANDDLRLPGGQPFDPIGEAMANIQRINELAAAKARIAQLEKANEEMREAGDELWYVVRHAPECEPQDIIDACSTWADKRRHG